MLSKPCKKKKKRQISCGERLRLVLSALFLAGLIVSCGMEGVIGREGKPEQETAGENLPEGEATNGAGTESVFSIPNGVDFYKDASGIAGQTISETIEENTYGITGEPRKDSVTEEETEGKTETITETEENRLMSLYGLPAGTILEENQIYEGHLEYYFTSSQILQGDAIYQRINGKSYRENPDITLSELRYLKVLHINFDGQIQVGELIINARIADATLAIFRRLYENRYPICQMRLIDDFWDTDGVTTDRISILHDNTSAFNYRVIANTTTLSNHALGMAIDINPFENPYVYLNADGSYDLEGFEQAEIDSLLYREGYPHAIDHDDLAYQLFTAYGFSWGGDWTNVKDYQHFEFVE